MSTIGDLIHHVEQAEKAIFPADARLAWIQWKGTDVCMDFPCACGELLHIDGWFVYNVRCGACKRTYAMGCHVLAIEVTGTPLEAVAEAHCLHVVEAEG